MESSRQLICGTPLNGVPQIMKFSSYIRLTHTYMCVSIVRLDTRQWWVFWIPDSIFDFLQVVSIDIVSENLLNLCLQWRSNVCREGCSLSGHFFAVLVCQGAVMYPRCGEFEVHNCQKVRLLSKMFQIWILWIERLIYHDGFSSFAIFVFGNPVYLS